MKYSSKWMFKMNSITVRSTLDRKVAGCSKRSLTNITLMFHGQNDVIEPIKGLDRGWKPCSATATLIADS